MIDTSLAQPSRTVPDSVVSRVRRGLELYRERGEDVEPLGHGYYKVPGCSGGSYEVDLAVFGGQESCKCPDFRRHKSTCKHIITATLYRAKSRAASRRRAQARKRRVALVPEDAGEIRAALERMGA